MRDLTRSDCVFVVSVVDLALLSDAVLIELTKRSVPSTQTKLLHACISRGAPSCDTLYLVPVILCDYYYVDIPPSGRVSVVEAVVQHLLKRDGANATAKYLHGGKCVSLSHIV